MQKSLDPMSVQKAETPSASYVLRRRYGPARHIIAAASWITVISMLLQPVAVWAGTRNWDGDTDTAWSTSGNWDTTPVNDLTSDIANFNLVGPYQDASTPRHPDAGTRSIGGITIGSSNGAMTLSGTALSIGAGGITIASGAGALTLSPTTITLGESQTWVNTSANLFTVSGNIGTDGATAGSVLTVGGTGNTTISGLFFGENYGYLVKNDPGTLTLTGTTPSDWVAYPTVYGGELKVTGSDGAVDGCITLSLAGSGVFTLDNSVNNKSEGRLRDGTAVNLYGGTLKFLGNKSETSSETVGAMTVNLGYASTVDIQAGTGQSATMTFDSYSRSSGGAVNVKYTGAGASVDFTTAPPTLKNGIVNGMFVNGADFATLNGNAITALPAGSYTEMATSGTDTNNSIVTSGKTLTGALTTNSLKIDGGQTVDLSTYTLKLGAASGLAAMILKTSLGDATISGSGYLTSVATTTDLVVRVNEGSLTISAPVDLQSGASGTGTGRLNKSGPGLLILNPSAAWLNTNLQDILSVQEGAIRLDPTDTKYGDARRELAGGVFELTNDWSPTIGVSAKNLAWRAYADGGFAANGATRTVMLGSTLTWGATSPSYHVQNGKALLFNSDTADAKIVMANGIDLAGTTGEWLREIRVAGNANAAAYAEISGNISGTYNRSHLLKTGAGRLDLSTATSTYLGQTFVQAGTLNVNGTLDSSGGLVTVMTTATVGGTLGGTGTINRPVTVRSGGALRPGGSIGKLTVGADISHETGSIFAWKAKGYNADGGVGTAGTDYSQLVVNGGGKFTLAGGTKLEVRLLAEADFTGSFWNTDQTWDIITGGSGDSSGSIADGDISVYVNGSPYDGGDREITGQGAFSTSYVANGILRLKWTAQATATPPGTIFVIK